jgi:hypothetical protein
VAVTGAAGSGRRWILLVVGAAALLLTMVAAVAAVQHSGRLRARAVAADASAEPPGVDEIGAPGTAPGSVPPVPPSTVAPPSAGASASPPGPATSGPGNPGGGGPTAGLHPYTDTYKVQQPYDLAVSDRFSVTAGPTYNAWVLKGDKPFSAGSGTGPRTEMRWGNWSGVEHMWEADVLIDTGTTGAAIMQVKSNDGYEPVYVNVKGDGDLYNDSNHTVLASGVWGVWFHLICGYDPVSGDGRVWINGRLAITRHDPHPVGTVWYFKNGVYNVTGAKAEAHFRNVRFWTR